MTETEYATAVNLISYFEGRGIILDVRGNRLVAHPARRLKRHDRELIRANWSSLFEVLRWWRT